MKVFEIARLALAPALPPLAYRVRRDLKSLVGPLGRALRLLDVGARNSPYTIGLPVRVTLLDVPRKNEIQTAYNLGVEERDWAERIRKRRSNVEAQFVQDFTRNSLPSASFDVVTSVEVIEHVEKDEDFVREVARVLKPEGFAYLTTPNGDAIPVPSPQHVRHYRRTQLDALCRRFFQDVSITYAIRLDRWHRLGHRGYSLDRPIRTLLTIGANILQKLTDANDEVRMECTAHLIAVCRGPQNS